jgi:hypothetical protein
MKILKVIVIGFCVLLQSCDKCVSPDYPVTDEGKKEFNRKISY